MENQEPLSEDFKRSFGRLLVFLKTTPGSEARMRYSSTLLEIVEAGLAAIGKQDLYKPERRLALGLFNTMTLKTRTQGRPEFVNAEIVGLTNRIGIILMPIIVKEGLALIDDAAFGKVNSESSNSTFEGFGR